jgi:indole-3-glycerol phosphate synthase
MGRFKDALAAPGLRAVAEVKRRSPSAGELRPDADPGALARAFEQNGAAAVSILVDDRFGGCFDDLAAARAATTVPLLAKGFFDDQGDLLQARIAGADAALLLLRDLNDDQARLMLAGGRELGLDLLVEAHDEQELDRAMAAGTRLVGVNNRDLRTFEIDRSRAIELRSRVPKSFTYVAESGIEAPEHIRALRQAGVDAVLVGTLLMAADDPGAALGSLLEAALT